MTGVREQAVSARAAGRRLAALDRATKDAALQAVARHLRDSVQEIGRINAQDVEAARRADLSAAMINRLEMTPKVVEATAAGVDFVASLPDPVGSRAGMQRLQNGLLIGKQRIPLGVIAMIYESRPNVTVDAAVLCLKAGNACLLRGGKEAHHTNQFLGELIATALDEVGLPSGAVQIVPATDREGIKELLSLTGLVDLAIPRGGEGLIRFVHENARVPTVEHYKGVCHLFVDRGADLEMAVQLALNGKVQRPGVCNALECVLVDANEAERFLPLLGEAMGNAQVELRACERSLPLLTGAVAAQDSDWGAEFLEKILAVRVVDGFEAALGHIERHGSNHTEAICTRDYTRSQRWLREVDASCVLVNASTRFNDGGQLGLGAEIGISTSKLHAYGPMGIESLTTEKWVVLGEGQVRT
ncbi:MAG: glutamate-5-semialdehyde dehydrogenase [Polyangiaceae bacterium]|nr:glutamate-5-semialdehyde dehydrogenase [Polyangiaceae bacterium]